MNKQILKALKESIQVWHSRAYYSDEIHGRCPLCVVVKFECSRCPVAHFSGLNGCGGTPYQSWRHSVGQVRIDAAEKELEFLVCLLPENETVTMTDGWVWGWEYR